MLCKLLFWQSGFGGFPFFLGVSMLNSSAYVIMSLIFLGKRVKITLQLLEMDQIYPPFDFGLKNTLTVNVLLTFTPQN